MYHLTHTEHISIHIIYVSIDSVACLYQLIASIASSCLNRRLVFLISDACKMKQNCHLLPTCYNRALSFASQNIYFLKFFGKASQLLCCVKFKPWFTKDEWHYWHLFAQTDSMTKRNSYQELHTKIVDLVNEAAKDTHFYIGYTNRIKFYLWTTEAKSQAARSTRAEKNLKKSQPVR